jgi:hypothetical protein
MVKEADSNIIFLIIVVVRILFLREVWWFRRLMPIENGMTYAVKYPKTPQTLISIFFENAMIYYYAKMLIHSLDWFLGDFEWLEGGVVPPR